MYTKVDVPCAPVSCDNPSQIHLSLHHIVGLSIVSIVRPYIHVQYMYMYVKLMSQNGEQLSCTCTCT